MDGEGMHHRAPERHPGCGGGLIRCLSFLFKLYWNQIKGEIEYG